MRPKHTFAEGERVQIISSGSAGHRAAGEGVVGRIFKTGNFKLVNREGQWRPHGTEAGERATWSSYFLLPYGSDEAIGVRRDAKRRKRGRDIAALAEEVRLNVDRIQLVNLNRIHVQLRLALACAEEQE